MERCCDGRTGNALAGADGDGGFGAGGVVFRSGAARGDVICEKTAETAALLEGDVHDFERHVLRTVVTHQRGGLEVAQAELKFELYRRTWRQVAADFRHAAGEAGGFDLKAA